MGMPVHRQALNVVRNLMSLTLRHILLAVFSLVSYPIYSQTFEEFWRDELRKVGLKDGDTAITYKYAPFIYSPSDSVKGLGEVRYHNLAYIIAKNKKNITITKLIDYFYIIEGNSRVSKSIISVKEDNALFFFLSAHYKMIATHGDQILPYIRKVENDSTVAFFPVHSSHPVVISIGVITKDHSFEYEVDSDSIVPGYGMLDVNLNYEYNIQRKTYQLYHRIKQLLETIDKRFTF